MTDITEHPTREGKVYRCVVLDTFSRRVVGWAIDTSPDRRTSHQRSAWPSTPGCKNTDTIIHPGHGVQVGSWAFTDRAKASGLVCSMGSICDCYDTP